jgi:c-di-GMP-binding flagellar brake protein YcgR
MREENVAGGRGERRKHPRLDKIIKMRYQRLESLSEKTPYREATLLDISSGGLRFLVPKPLEINSQLVIVLEFPGWLNADERLSPAGNDGETTGVIQALGQVLRVQASETEPGQYEIGVQFSSQLQEKEI